MFPATSLEALLAQPRAYSREALVARWGRRAIDAAVQSGALVRIARGAYVGARHERSCWAAASIVTAEAGPGASVTGRAALFLQGALIDAPASAMVVMPAERHLRRRFPGVRLLRSRHSVPHIEAQGMPVAEPEWALVHAVREVPKAEALGLAFEALGSGELSLWRLVELLESMPRAPRRAVLRRALAGYDAGARSILEYRGLREVLFGNAFADLRWQYPVAVAGKRFVLDAFDGTRLVAFEFDGRRFHASAGRWQADRERDALLASVGIQTVRFTYRDVVERPEWCREVALAVLAARVGVGRAA